MQLSPLTDKAGGPSPRPLRRGKSSIAATRDSTNKIGPPTLTFLSVRTLTRASSWSLLFCDLIYFPS
jgi:hypothetical protein